MPASRLGLPYPAGSQKRKQRQAANVRVPCAPVCGECDGVQPRRGPGPGGGRHRAWSGRAHAGGAAAAQQRRRRRGVPGAGAIWRGSRAGAHMLGAVQGRRAHCRMRLGVVLRHNLVCYRGLIEAYIVWGLSARDCATASACGGLSVSMHGVFGVARPRSCVDTRTTIASAYP